MIEINILEDLRGKSLGGTHFEDDAPFVQLWDWFDYRGHVCMVFEPLGTSLYDFLSKNGPGPHGVATRPQRFP
jgi:hypothetical protein